MTPRRPALGAHSDPAAPRAEEPAHLGLRVAAPGCSECRRVAQTVLEGLEGVLLVESRPGSAAITVTYDPRLLHPAEIRSAAQQAGCTST